ncbi:MAG: aminotransferase class I/II-fold pyridoxal phosphate-dependent enzyme [Hyphomicrobiales bacterium]
MNNYQDYLCELRDKGNYRSLSSLNYRGINNLNLSSNDYLGIGSRKDLQKEFAEFIDVESFQMSAVSSRLLSGNHHEYERLEHELSEFYGKSALVFNSGWHANTAILPALLDKDDVVIADKLVHASIIDGMKLCNATTMRFRHLDYKHLEQLIIKYQSAKRIFVVTESVFSMDGDVADASELIRLKEKYGIWLYVDEAHSCGVMGNLGKGWCEENDMLDHIDILLGTFGKAYASIGSFLICDRRLKEVLINKARSLIFSTALPPVNVAWSRFILEQIPGMQQERTYLKEISQQLRDVIKASAFRTLGSSHIVPMIVGDNSDTLELSDYYKQNGFFVLPIRPPTVPQGTARLRFSLTAGISKYQIQELLSFTKSIERHESILEK